MCEDDENILNNMTNNMTNNDDSIFYSDSFMAVTIFLFIFGGLCLTSCIMCCNNEKKNKD